MEEDVDIKKKLFCGVNTLQFVINAFRVIFFPLKLSYWEKKPRKPLSLGELKSHHSTASDVNDELLFKLVFL